MLQNRFGNFSLINTISMRFAAKVVLSDHIKRDGTQGVYIRAVIDRRPASVSLGFCVVAKDFDSDRGMMKSSAANSDLINFQMAEAVARANKIFLDYKYSDRYLNPESFRKEFTEPTVTMDFVSFMEKEIELRKPKLEAVTYGSHITILNKLKSFQKKILFAELDVNLVQRFENYLITKNKLSTNTVHKVFRCIKVYIHEAERKNIRFKNPFNDYKVKTVAPKKPTLSIEELRALFEYFKRPSIDPSHKKVLRYFLFSCTSGVRISDIHLLEWDHLQGNSIVFNPFKTRKRNRYLTIPLLDIHFQLMEERTSKFLFDCFAMPVSNRILKDIAKACEIRINLTYHISRHTFATEFLNNGGQLDTLQQLLGHSMITTTMQYVKVNDKRKREELSNAFNDLNTMQNKPGNPAEAVA